LRRDPDGIERDVEMTLGLFPVLEERKNQMARTLSGGEQQMLTLGRALLADPKLLMLDEPSMGLAPIVKEKIMDVVFEIRKRGVTVLLVEQDVVLALKLCDRGYVFEEGTVFIEGTNEELKKNPRVREAYLGCN